MEFYFNHGASVASHELAPNFHNGINLIGPCHDGEYLRVPVDDIYLGAVAQLAGVTVDGDRVAMKTSVARWVNWDELVSRKPQPGCDLPRTPPEVLAVELRLRDVVLMLLLLF